MAQGIWLSSGDVIDYTPSGSVGKGDVVIENSLVGFARDAIAASTKGALDLRGVGRFTKASGTTIAIGKRVYWDDSNNRVTETASGNKYLGITVAEAGSAQLYADVKIDSQGEQAQAAVVAAFTDNGGGTADGIIASMAAATTLTDSTGLSGSHDDTLAATSVPADLTGGEDPTEAEHNALLAVVRVMAQNDSDLAQKIIELVTWQTVVQNNVKECSAKIDAILVALKNAGLMATS